MTDFESGTDDTRGSLLEELPVPAQTGRATSTRRRRWLPVASLAAVLAGALAVLGFAHWAGPASASSVGPIAWKAPEAIDTSAPYTSPNAVRSISCATSTSCVADTGFGGIVSSTDPTGSSTSDWSSVSPASLVASGASPYSLATVSCASSFCATGGSNINDDYGAVILTSSDPTGGSASDWKTASLSDPNEISFIQCQSSSSCIALDAEGYVLSYNGSSWSRSSSSLVPNEDHNISGLSCPSASLCLASDYSGDVFISQDPSNLSTAWTEQTSSTTGARDAQGGISCSSTSDCALFSAGDEGAVYTTNASSSTPTWSVGAPNAALDGDVSTGTCLSGTSDCLLSDPGALYGSTNGGQSFGVDGNYPDTLGGPVSFGCAGSSLCVAGTSNGELSHSSDPSGAASSIWSSGLLVAPGLDSAQFGPDSCPSSTLCVGTDTVGRVLTGTPGSFTSKLLSDGGDLGPATCPSTSLCVATNGYDIFSSTDPAAGASSWRETASNLTGGAYIVALRCPSATLCVGVDYNNDIISSTTPGTGSWKVGTTPVAADPATASALTCPSTSLCVGYAENQNTGTDSYVFRSTSPSSVNSGWSGGSTLVDKGYMTGLVCPSTSLCIGYDYNGNVLSSTDPAAGSWSSPSALSGGVALGNLACPSSKLCVGYGDVNFGSKDYLITSTDPSGAASHWTVSGTAIDAYPVDDVACPSTGLCLLTDAKGNALESTDPSGGVSSWTTVAIDPGHVLQSLACHGLALCVAADNAGNVVEGVPTVKASPPKGSASKAKVKGTKLSVTVACTGASGQSCTLELRLSAKSKTVGSRTVRVEAGRHEKVALGLNRAGKKLLRKHRTLRAVFTVKQGTHTLRRQTVRFRRT